MAARPGSQSLRYEPHERPPLPIFLGLGLQNALLAIAPAVLLPLIVVKGAGGSAADAVWMTFAAVVVLGLTTILLTIRIGPIGVGCNVFPGASIITIPFCILALTEGGTSTLATLVLASALFQIVISMRLALLRRIVTPTVNGTIMILIVITVVPVLFNLIEDVPDGAPSAAGPVCILLTFAAMVGILLRSSGSWRMWAPTIGIGIGCAAAVAFGLFDLEPLEQSPWFGFPLSSWPGFGLDFGPAFWTLLPAFLFTSAVAILQTNTMSFSSLRVSWRDGRAIDFRRVQGGAMSNGLGNLLSGFAGAVPIETGPRGSMLVLQTGCASRYIGILVGVIYIAVSFFPKLPGLIGTIPGPVVAVFLVVTMAPLLVEGMRTIIEEEFDYRKSLVVGVAIMVGLGFQFDMVTLPIGGLWGPMLQKGLTAGGLTAIFLTIFTELTSQGRRRLQSEVNVEELPRINKFLQDFSLSRGWNDEMSDRLYAVAEETLLILAPQDEDRRLLLVFASSNGPTAELEFISAPSHADNLEDRIALLKKPVPEIPELETMVERDVSLRLLRYYASSVSHQQYRDTEIITVRVAPLGGE